MLRLSIATFELMFEIDLINVEQNFTDIPQKNVDQLVIFKIDGALHGCAALLSNVCRHGDS